MIRSEFLAKQPPLKTPRTQLVPIGPRFGPQVRRAASDPEIRRLTGAHRTPDQDQLRQRLETVAGRDDQAEWAIVRGQDASYLGRVALDDLDRANESMTYKISLRGTDVAGQGYGTEAGEAVINFGLGILGLHRIQLAVYAFNERAIKSFSKIGFETEGVLRHALLWDGRWYDQLIMSVLTPGALDQVAEPKQTGVQQDG
ncbi:GNAT family N-acetyltransferase [Microlunatus elymi]|uniref:GNAT family N-acetyltransferase n=1 Tax=Microlunatus elymi TaxID=2596828 RepID=A0A516PZX6_9ACTN|nr:GNAT family protein [Microlunatus elymi]QDP96745.1 GNAT family N-acetyltransferase [Microlunatus elymi]